MLQAQIVGMPAAKQPAGSVYKAAERDRTFRATERQLCMPLITNHICLLPNYISSV